MGVVGAAAIRAEVLRVMLKVTSPLLEPAEALAVARPLVTRRDVRFLHAATLDDVALANACLAVEHECRREEWAALERLLTLCQFDEGALDERLRALPLRAFGRAALDLQELGWITHTKED